MVFLHQQMSSSLKRDSSSSSRSSFPVPPSKIPKSSDSEIEKMASILADAGCTLMYNSGPPVLPSDTNKLRRHLTSLFSQDSTLRSHFLLGFSSYIQSPKNFARILSSLNPGRNDSLVRHLLLVPCIQLDLMNLLLEKLPEFFDINSETQKSQSLEDDVGRLIINQFRWLDFLVDPKSFTDKLMEILIICPLHLKKEIIGSLPEIIGDQTNNKSVIDSLQEMLKEDSAVIVPVLDSFSNLNLDDELQEQVITIALSCIRSIDAEHMPYLLRFLLLSAKQSNVRRIISHVRQHLKFVGVSSSRALQQNKLKGKSVMDNSEVSILDALRSSLRFKNMLCQEILKELNSLKKPQDHKVIDIWLLVLMYTNGDHMQKSILKIFKKKIIENCIQEVMLDQCIRGNKELVQDYYSSFLCLSEYLLACKEQKAREFGIHAYTSLFEEFTDTYSRQEVLGSLITHLGSGVSFEVSSALEAMALLVSKFVQELIPLSSHINGILDYLEGYSVENLHKVYEVFSSLALSARTSAHCFGSSIANELLMVVRKQVSHSELKYKKMGLIGTLKIVSYLGDASNVSAGTPCQKSNAEEAVELIKTSLNSCKQLYLPLTLFYDELTAILNHRTLQPEIIEWIGKYVGEFESLFLSDLESGQLPNKDSYCGIEGELWMNLDGDISPICLNILPLASSCLKSASLQILHANFLLLSAVERLTNQGSLGGIDALLGCPLHLPSSKCFAVAGWQSLSEKQKQIVSLSLYHAANWIRELLNAFCTQVTGRLQCTSQSTREDIIAKLLKRLWNLVVLESLLNFSIKCCPQSLPELHLHLEQSGSSLLNQPNNMGHVERNEQKKTHDSSSQDKKRKHKKVSKASTVSDTNCKLRQPTILDVFRKGGNLTSQEVPNGDSLCTVSKGRKSGSADETSCGSNEQVILEVSAVAKALETQRFKFRPLLSQCLSVLTFSKKQDSCCSDSAAELPLYLYLLRDFHYKLDYFTPSKLFCTRSVPAGFTRMTVEEFLTEVKPVFPCLRKHFDSAVCILKEGDETCEDRWKAQSAFAGIPDIPNLLFSSSSVSTLVIKEVLSCFRKMLDLLEIHMDKSVLSDLLQSFQPIEIPNSVISGTQPIPLTGTTEYLYLGAFSFLEGVLNIACSFSFMLASESLLTLESIVISLKRFLDTLEGNGESTHSGFIQGVLRSLCNRLGTSAEKLLKHNWDDGSLENGWKNRGEIVRKILWIYLEHSESTFDLLHELACSILPQVTLCKTTAEVDHHGFPTLCPATFTVWYRVLHEVNLSILNKLVKEIVQLEKQKAGVLPETVQTHLVKTQKCVNVVVSLVNMCRNHDKVTVHAMAVKYGGKFVDFFLKTFDFLQVHFQTHNEIIIQLVKELQKATRTIQILCSEAKGLKQTVITGKIPGTKRSMERFLFHVKTLLHTTSSGCTFWMGNLKHKDLMGQVVSSQAYVDELNNNVDKDLSGAVGEDLPVSLASEDRETE
ncbi:Fanconi anemia group D2 protein [Melia azedarach]|uniref:Fanconi anemia group D2 protein n=1 Tax=Melia azedarach TaxID=155640 RepID=A0ACC1X306_MELAZ|nr:Fanconi anemia group D2 protein [Melia azedarach]